MQLTGTEFTKSAAVAGNDIATFPDFPAEIRAPAGSLAGVSGFQLHFSSSDIFTPGDAPDVLVVMNPAALKTNLPDVVENGIVIVNIGTFTDGNLKKAGYENNPLEDNTLDGYRSHLIDITQLTMAALEETDLSTKEKARCKNFFALGLLYWVYSRDPGQEIAEINKKFGRKPRLADANVRVFKAGYHYGETAEVFQGVYEVPPAEFEPGTYRNITGNEATAIGLSPQRSWPNARLCTRAIRLPRRRPCCTTCPTSRTSASSRSSAKTKSRPCPRRWASPTAALLP